MDQSYPAARRLVQFMNRCPSPYHAVAQVRRQLEDAGYQPYQAGESLQTGDRRFWSRGGSALFAFSVGRQPLDKGFCIVGAHTDGPGLKIKPGSVLEQAGSYCLNTEIYGGPILHTWFDRPLGLAGQVAVQSDQPRQPEMRLLQIDRPLLVIPSLAIHLNRDVNQNLTIDKARVLLPVLGLVCEGQERFDFNRLLADTLETEPDRILDYSLFLYETTPACLLGVADEMVNGSRLDNLGMVHAACEALLSTSEHSGINLAAFFDHEEVGSRSRLGASSTVLRDLIEQLVYSLGGSRRDFLAVFDHSFLISADQAHAVHPHYKELADQTNRPGLNQGPVLKTAASQAYVTDSESMAVFRQLCRSAGVNCQVFANRSDQRGGTTLGPLTVEKIPLPAVDIGNPIWAMHACRETGGSADQDAMIRVLSRFYRGD